MLLYILPLIVMTVSIDRFMVVNLIFIIVIASKSSFVVFIWKWIWLLTSLKYNFDKENIWRHNTAKEVHGQRKIASCFDDLLSFFRNINWFISVRWKLMSIWCRRESINWNSLQCWTELAVWLNFSQVLWNCNGISISKKLNKLKIIEKWKPNWIQIEAIKLHWTLEKQFRTSN